MWRIAFPSLGRVPPVHPQDEALGHGQTKNFHDVSPEPIAALTEHSCTGAVRNCPGVKGDIVATLLPDHARFHRCVLEVIEFKLKAFPPHVCEVL